MSHSAGQLKCEGAWRQSAGIGPISAISPYVDIDDYEYSRPWNARPETARLPAGVPSSNLWAYEPNGIDQIGCVYTAQGFEFDYVGVIFGTDLKFNPDNSTWEGHPENSKDNQVSGSEDFLKLVKNTYRVLLTRGMK